MWRNKLPFLSTFFLAAAAAFAGQQQNQAPQKQEIVVTGTYTPVPLEEADRTVQSIAVKGSPAVFRNLMDALQSDPAIDLRQRAPGIQGDLSIRGSSFGQTLVLVDGFRLNDAQTGHNNLDVPFPFEAIQRVEVLEGSGSTLYGSDAIGGAVNLITGPPPTTELRLGTSVGNFGTNAQNGSLTLLDGTRTEQLTFSRELSTGFMPDRDYRNLAFASQSILRSRLGESDILLGYSDRPFGADHFYGNFPSWERTKGWFAGIRQDLGAATNASFSYRRHTDLFDLFRSAPSIYENRHITESWAGALRRTQSFTDTTRLYYGAEGYRDSIDSTNLGHRTRDRGAAYLDLDLRALRRFSLSAGAREELITGGRKRLSPSVSGGYWLNSRLKLHASVSSGFRLPTFTDLYYSDPANKGNPNLLPETAWSYEGGLLSSAGRSTADIVLFYRRDNNIIDYVRATPASVWQAENLTRLRFTGVEAKWRLQLSARQRLDFLYTGLHGAQSVLGGMQSKYVFEYPVHSGTLTWWGELPGSIQTHLRLRTVQRFGRDVYPVLDLSASRELRFVKPYLQLTNLTNTGYEEIIGVRMPGRGAMVGLEFYWR